MKQILMATAVAMMACVSCSAAEKSRDINITESFTGLVASSNIEIIYTPSNRVEVKVKAEEQVLDDVKVYVSDNKLHMSINRQGAGGSYEAKVYLSCPAMNEVTISGNCEFKSRSAYTAPMLKLSLSGNSEFSLPGMNIDALAVSLSGNSEVSAGVVMSDRVTISASGNSEFSCRSVNCNDCALSASGNSEITLNESGIARLAANAQGNAELSLGGRVQTVAYNASGCAVIDAMALLANGGTANASGRAVVKCNVPGLVSQSGGNAVIKNKNA